MGLDMTRLGEVVEFPLAERIPFRNLREPRFIHDGKYVINTSPLDLYRKADVDESLYTSNPALTFASITENVKLGGIDANSPHVASIGSGASKVSVYSIFTNSSIGAPTLRASSTGISEVSLITDTLSLSSNNIAWSVVSNGSKFFAYPVSTADTGLVCRVSIDGNTWSSETMTGDYPTTFQAANTWRWFYNIPQSGYGIVPEAANRPDFFSIGSNIFLIDGVSIRMSTNGFNWTNLTTSVFGNGTAASKGFYIGINGTSAFIANVYGIRYTIDSGVTWINPSNTILVPTGFGFTENQNSKAKYVAKNAGTNNLYYISTNTGASWARFDPGVNSNRLMYRNSTIIVLTTDTRSCRISTNEGGSFTDVVLPSTFAYPIKSSAASENWFYLVDAEGGVFRSADGVSWVLLNHYLLDAAAVSVAKSLSPTMDILYSLNDNTPYPYVCVYNSGANVTIARFGQAASSLIYPAISGNTDVYVCNANTTYSAKTTIADIQTPPYMRFSDVPVSSTRTGMYPYIRIG